MCVIDCTTLHFIIYHYYLPFYMVFVVDYATIVKIDMICCWLRNYHIDWKALCCWLRDYRIDWNFVVDYATILLNVDIQWVHSRTLNSIVAISGFQYDIYIYIYICLKINTFQWLVWKRLIMKSTEYIDELKYSSYVLV